MFLDYSKMSDAEIDKRLSAIIDRIVWIQNGNSHGDQMYIQALNIRDQLELEKQTRLEKSIAEEWDNTPFDIGHEPIEGNPFTPEQVKKDRFGQDANKTFRRRPLNDDSDNDDQ